MDLVKQYVVQSITTASSNMRLSNQRIEVIAMLKDVILRSNNLQNDLNQMKKITELSKLAIKLNEIINYLNEGSIDFLKVTDKFKEHSFNLMKDLSCMLDMVNPYTFSQTLERLNEPEKKIVEIIVEPNNRNSDAVTVELCSDNLDSNEEPSKVKPEIKEFVALDINKENKEQKSFNNFESTILKPIKLIDSMLTELNADSEIPIEVEEYSNLMTVNAELSLKSGFEILSQMHEIIAAGLVHLKDKTLVPSKEVIESLRACLIVIVAVVKSKEVDITNYLNRAEVFGKFLQKIKAEEIK